MISFLIFFIDDTPYSPYCISGVFPKLRDHKMGIFGDKITIEEIKKALFSMGNYKAPRVDGLHAVLYKSQLVWWQI